MEPKLITHAREIIAKAQTNSFVETKPWYTSKIVLGGVVVTLISVLELFSAWYQKNDFGIPSVITLIVGILLIVSRVWLTNTTLTK